MKSENIDGMKSKEEKCVDNTCQLLICQLNVLIIIYNIKEDKLLHKSKQCHVTICLICGHTDYINTNPKQQNDF